MPATAPPRAAAAPVLTTASRGLRADASRNRAAILSAAREVFGRQGLQAPLEDIARQAGVGIATLYRRFPTRERLVTAALTEKVSQYASAAGDALADPDPWSGFAGFVHRICALQAGDRGLSDLLSTTLPGSEELEVLRARARADVAELTERAKAAGRLRPDFVAEDLMLVLIANAAVVRVTGPKSDAWRRLVALFLDALQYGGGDRLSAAPSIADMSLVTTRQGAVPGCGPPAAEPA